jgi:ferric-dicitrate binding protein FerR (iron transport regulator)
MSLHPMNPPTLGRATTLAKGTLQSIADARGTSVQCLQGAIWLTQQGEARDLVLEAGDQVMIERNGTSIVFALADARFVMSDGRGTADATPLPRQARQTPPPVDAATAS